MGRICVIAAEGSLVAQSIVQRLAGHFGASSVVALPGVEAPPQPDDVVVVLLEPAAAEPGGSPTSELSVANHPHVAHALAENRPLIPVLLDGVRMPLPDQLPLAVRALSYQHAIVARSDARLQRDVGRLIVDLEAHLKRAVGSRFPYEHVALPFGVILTIIGGFYAVVRWREATDWSFAYETPAAWDAALSMLTRIGPWALGAGLFVIAAAAWMRRWRIYLRERAEAFRGGASPPPAPQPWPSLSFGAGLASWGWGWPASLAAIAAGAWSGASTARRGGRDDWRRIALGLFLGIAGCAWTQYVAHRVNVLRATLVQHDLGRQAVEANDLAAAVQRFGAAAEIFPSYANAWLRLGEVLDRQGKPTEALRAVERAIQSYPTGGQGFVSPPTQVVDDAERLQADLSRRLSGQQETSGGFQFGFDLNIFGGLIRFW